MDGLTDEDLIARSRSQPKSSQAREALDELFRRYFSRVAWWCFRMTGDREAAEDLSQEIFARAYENLDSYNGTARFSTWLYAVTRNHCTNQMRSKAVRPEPFGEGELERLVDGRQLDAQTLLEQTETVRAMINHSLDATEQEVLVLHYGHEFTLDSITRMLGLTNASGAKAFLVSARRKLASVIRQHRAVEARRQRTQNSMWNWKENGT